MATLTDSEKEELRTLLDAIHRRLDLSNYQMLARAKYGQALSRGNAVPLIVDIEIAHIRSIKRMFGLPFERRVPSLPSEAPEPEQPLREQMLQKGIEPDSVRKVRRFREKREQGKKST